jgi:D-glycero-D-manno-heptose 1,7-bisphosphate phosphatase
MLRFLHNAPKPSKNPDDNRIIFIDRDGVINVDFIGDYVKTRQDFKFEPGAIEALKWLVAHGVQIIVISNQAGVGDGLFTESALKDIHRYMVEEFEKNKIFIRSAHYCLHGKEGGCKCRKPETGLFEDAVHNMPYHKDKTYFIGDKKTDIEAGKRFGLKTIFVRTGHGKTDEAKLGAALKPDILADNLLEAVKKIPL